LATNNSRKNIIKNSGLQPHKEKLILFIPNTILIGDFISIVIFKQSILRWNLWINDVAFKMMTMNNRFNLLNPKKIVLCMQFLGGGRKEESMRKPLTKSLVLT